jgi:hypothetical protein
MGLEQQTTKNGFPKEFVESSMHVLVLNISRGDSRVVSKARGNPRRLLTSSFMTSVMI